MPLPRAALLASLALLLIGTAGQAQARKLRADEANPFLRPSPATPQPSASTAPQPSAAPVPAPTLSPAVDGTATLDAAAASPPPAGPCSCTADGLSGGTNTTRAGCAQWDVSAGSNALTCFVQVCGWVGHRRARGQVTQLPHHPQTYLASGPSHNTGAARRTLRAAPRRSSRARPATPAPPSAPAPWPRRSPTSPPSPS